MRIDGRLLGWGLFFIVLGAVPLAAQRGLVDHATLERWWQLWPVLLIGAGLGLIVRRTPLEGIGSLVGAVVFGLMFGSVIALGGDLSSFGGCASGQPGPAFQTRDGTLGPTASVELSLGCGELDVATAAGSVWRVTGNDSTGRGPSVDGSSTRLRLSSPGGAGPFPFATRRQRWDVTLPTESTIALDASANAGPATLDLRGARLSRLSVSVNAGSGSVDLTDATVGGPLQISVNGGSGRVTLPATSLSGELSVNAGSLRFCVPAGVGVRITMEDNVTGSNNFASRGLARTGNVWQSPDYASAANQVQLRASANAGSVALNPDGGC